MELTILSVLSIRARELEEIFLKIVNLWYDKLNFNYFPILQYMMSRVQQVIAMLLFWMTFMWILWTTLFLRPAQTLSSGRCGLNLNGRTRYAIFIFELGWMFYKKVFFGSHYIWAFQHFIPHPFGCEHPNHCQTLGHHFFILQRGIMFLDEYM